MTSVRVGHRFFRVLSGAGGGLLLTLTAPPRPAVAQPTATGAPVAAPAHDAATRIEERYHEAFQQLAEGDRAAAERSLRALLAVAPEHPLAARAR